MLPFLDLFFLVFHTSLILFNLFGWIHPRTRKLHLFSLSLTLLSWLGLGYFYTWGYCVCTDWHWQVLREMGQEGLPSSYLSYLVQRFFGVLPDRSIVDPLAVAGLLLPLCLNLLLRWRGRLEKR